jgi:hypothetical protein
MTQIYRMNYPEAARGKLYAIAGVTRAGAAVAFGYMAGWLLDLDLKNYTWLLWAYAISGFVSGLWTYGLPATPWQPEENARTSLWSAWRWVREDHDFRTLLISWMMMGVGNLAAACLFVEYLANPVHGINLPEKQVAFITCVVPVLARLVFSYPWGLVYDRFHLFGVRAALNVFFAAGIAVGHETRPEACRGRVHERSHLSHRPARARRPVPRLRAAQGDDLPDLLPPLWSRHPLRQRLHHRPRPHQRSRNEQKAQAGAVVIRP